MGECASGALFFFLGYWQCLSHLWVRDMIQGDVLAGDEVVVATLEHETGEVAHDWLCLEVKVPQHCQSTSGR